MNIFDEIYRINANRLEKRAASITLANGEKYVYTYGEIFAGAERYAQLLLDSGVRPGDRIAITAESSPWWITAFFAICRIRCTAALIDASLTEADTLSFISRSDVRGAFFSKKTYGKIRDKGSL